MSQVIVAGSINMDIIVFTDRHPKIGESIIGTDVQQFPGGKGANQAIASAKLQAQTRLLGRVGDDAFGRKLLEYISAHHVNHDIQTVAETPTGTALITVAASTSDNTIVVIPGANFALTPEDVESITISSGDVLLSQYEIPDVVIITLFQKGRKAGALNVFNCAPAKQMTPELQGLVDILIVNETELEFLSGVDIDIDDKASLQHAFERINGTYQALIVTLGEQGAYSFIGGNPLCTPGISVPAVDTTGAGDCFCGALAAALIDQTPLKDAIAWANQAAAISVTKAGAGPSMPAYEEVIQYYAK